MGKMGQCGDVGRDARSCVLCDMTNRLGLEDLRDSVHGPTHIIIVCLWGLAPLFDSSAKSDPSLQLTWNPFLFCSQPPNAILLKTSDRSWGHVAHGQFVTCLVREERFATLAEPVFMAEWPCHLFITT